jgi:cold shock CspA family protein
MTGRVMNLEGTVERFDVATGLGEIVSAHGTTFSFHSTQIADRTRTIEVGAAVTFDVVPGHLGRWEAAAVTPA